MTESAYIHIPFCRQKCHYCSFISYPKLDLIKEYLIALNKDIKYFYQNEKLKTLYIGGGTPSLLSISQLDFILAPFQLAENCEITIELNPENLTKDYIKDLKTLGINRLSIGCQSFDSEILRLIGRKHSPKDVEFAVKTAQDNGFENISLDFIYGLPNQNTESFIQDLNHGVSLGIKHISLYGLKIENGCYFYNHPPQNIADDDTQAEMYTSAIDTLKNFKHYEISNFAKDNFYSRHNLTYWNNENYYGFGTAAHGYVKNTRYSNYADINEYIKTPLKKESENILSIKEQLEEEIFLGFRKISGIEIDKINEKYNIDFEKKYAQILKKYITSNHIKQTPNGYSLTTSGILVSNYILSEFIEI